MIIFLINLLSAKDSHYKFPIAQNNVANQHNVADLISPLFLFDVCSLLVLCFDYYHRPKHILTTAHNSPNLVGLGRKRT